MTASELDENLRLIGWSIRQTADRVGLQEQHIRRMINGEKPIPPELGRYIDAVATLIAAIVPPDLRDTF